MTTPDVTDRAAADSPQPGWTANRIGELVFACVVLCLGIYAFVGAFAIRVPAGAHVGPRVFPYLVSFILVIAGVSLVVGVLRGHLGAREEGEDIDPNAKTDWWTLGKLVAILIITIFVLEFLGWWMTAALLFGGAAWTLGAKKWWVALLVGLGLGIGTQLLFGEGLGLFLPRGWAFDQWYGPGPLFG